MLQHFEKLQTPLRSVQRYPKMGDQERRFLQAGWDKVGVRSLWELYCDPSVVPIDRKASLNAVEPFDEHEEFVLFASHYFLLEAKKTSPAPDVSLRPPQQASVASENQMSDSKGTVPVSVLNFEISSRPSGIRRFGAVFRIHEGLVGHHGGLGSQNRLDSVDMYRLDNFPKADKIQNHLSIEARMCHTITALNGGSALLVGGRTSPDRPLSDCWLFCHGVWKREEDFPTPVYRHCATSILFEQQNAVLVFGGKTSNGNVENCWHIWRQDSGWVRLATKGPYIGPRFGASIASDRPLGGILLGGMTADGTICNDVWDWSILNVESNLVIDLKSLNHHLLDPASLATSLRRFGAQLISSSYGFLLIGGVSDQLLPQSRDIVSLLRRHGEAEDELDFGLLLSPVKPPNAGQRPLLVGHVSYFCDDSIILVGGGAVCFSFGTYWNERIWTFRTYPLADSSPGIWELEAPQKAFTQEQSKWNKTSDSAKKSSLKRISVPRVKVDTTLSFEQRLRDAQPVVIEGLDIGPCVQEWSLDRLKAKIGADRNVSQLLSKKYTSSNLGV